MVDLDRRIGVIAKIAEEKPGLGKTAMMKFIFLLQKVYKVPLGYDFEIYTYGPYSSEVMEDIDLAGHQDILSIESVIYPSGHSGYNLTPSANAARAIDKAEGFIHDHDKKVKEVVNLFGDKTAKDLELATTIVYLYGTYKANRWKCTLEEISANVHEIKPHFSMETIKDEYRHLDGLGILRMAV